MTASRRYWYGGEIMNYFGKYHSLFEAGRGMPSQNEIADAGMDHDSVKRFLWTKTLFKKN